DTRGRAGRGAVADVATPGGKPGPVYLRCRILLRMRRFFRPTLRRPLRFFIRLTRLSRMAWRWPGRGEDQSRQAQLFVENLEALQDARRQALRGWAGAGAFGYPLQESAHQAGDLLAVAALAGLAVLGVPGLQLPEAPEGRVLAGRGEGCGPNLVF